eukprot:Rmarinus@m.21691
MSLLALSQPELITGSIVVIRDTETMCLYVADYSTSDSAWRWILTETSETDPRAMLYVVRDDDHKKVGFRSGFADGRMLTSRGAGREPVFDSHSYGRLEKFYFTPYSTTGELHDVNSWWMKGGNPIFSDPLSVPHVEVVTVHSPTVRGSPVVAATTLLREKDEKIQALEEENISLRKGCVDLKQQIFDIASDIMKTMGGRIDALEAELREVSIICEDSLGMEAKILSDMKRRTSRQRRGLSSLLEQLQSSITLTAADDRTKTEVAEEIRALSLALGVADASVVEDDRPLKIVHTPFVPYRPFDADSLIPNDTEKSDVSRPPGFAVGEDGRSHPLPPPSYSTDPRSHAHAFTHPREPHLSHMTRPGPGAANPAASSRRPPALQTSPEALPLALSGARHPAMAIAPADPSDPITETAGQEVWWRDVAKWIAGTGSPSPNSPQSNPVPQPWTSDVADQMSIIDNNTVHASEWDGLDSVSAVAGRADALATDDALPPSLVNLPPGVTLPPRRSLVPRPRLSGIPPFPRGPMG